MEYTFENFNFIFYEEENGNLCCMINILNEDKMPVYGSSGDSKSTMSEAIVSAAESFLRGWGSESHEDLLGALKAAYENKILAEFEPMSWLDSTAFVYKGEVMFVDPSMEVPYFEIRNYNFEKQTVFHLGAFDVWRLNQMTKVAATEGKADSDAYDAWEASWIDGPQWLW